MKKFFNTSPMRKTWIWFVWLCQIKDVCFWNYLRFLCALLFVFVIFWFSFMIEFVDFESENEWKFNIARVLKLFDTFSIFSNVFFNEIWIKIKIIDSSSLLRLHSPLKCSLKAKDYHISKENFSKSQPQHVSKHHSPPNVLT